MRRSSLVAGAEADPVALERVATEVQRRLEESRLRLTEFFVNYARLDRLAGDHELADAMETLARRVQVSGEDGVYGLEPRAA